MRWSTLSLSPLAAALLAGCASMDSFKQADADSRKGGAIDQAKAAEVRKQEGLKQAKVEKEDQLMQSTREKERMDRRLAAAQADLQQQDAALADALDKKRITQQQYADLKKQQDALKGDMASLQIKDRNDQKAKAPDPKVEAEKEAKLKALQQRKQDLEKALAAAMKS